MKRKYIGLLAQNVPDSTCDINSGNSTFYGGGLISAYSMVFYKRDDNANGTKTEGTGCVSNGNGSDYHFYKIGYNLNLSINNTMFSNNIIGNAVTNSAGGNPYNLVTLYGGGLIGVSE